MPIPKLFLLTGIALGCFAANSLLSRIALTDGATDALTFASLRHLSAAVSLTIIALFVYSIAPQKKARQESSRESWVSALWLLAYAFPFAIAYQELTAGTGALILFGFVQLTMIGWSIYQGERPSPVKFAGLGLAVIGMIFLFLPGATAPSLWGALLMGASGIAWGVYSLRGKKVGLSLLATKGHFLRGTSLLAVPIGLGASFRLIEFKSSVVGALLAAISGALTSGLGYALWYSVLPHIRSTNAATLQLMVPVLAVLAGFLFLDEQVSLRAGLSLLMILAGVLIWLKGKVGSREPTS